MPNKLEIKKSEVKKKFFRVKVEDAIPYRILKCAVYIFLSQTGKFALFKDAFDFLTEAEIKNARPFQHFYLLEMPSNYTGFVETGKLVRSILEWSPTKLVSVPTNVYPEAILPPAPFELSDKILKIIGSMWKKRPGEGLVIEPLNVTVFADQVCEVLSPEQLILARSKGQPQYIKAIHRPYWAVFLALHLGYCDLAFLNRLRNRVFNEYLNGKLRFRLGDEVDEIVALADETIEVSEMRRIRADVFRGRQSSVANKLEDRFQHLLEVHVNLRKSILVDRKVGLGDTYV